MTEAPLPPVGGEGGWGGGGRSRLSAGLAAYVAAGLDEPVLVMTGRPEDRALGLQLVRELAG